jgi:hypothetical protein
MFFKKSQISYPNYYPVMSRKKKTIIKAENKDKIKKESPLEIDPEKFHNSDPQEKMEGPISSIMQTIKEVGESNDVISKKETSKKKDDNT